MKIIDSSEWDEKEEAKREVEAVITYQWWRENVHSVEQKCWNCATIVELEPLDVRSSEVRGDLKWKCPKCIFTVKVAFAQKIDGKTQLAVKKYIEQKHLVSNAIGCIVFFTAMIFVGLLLFALL